MLRRMCDYNNSGNLSYSSFTAGKEVYGSKSHSSFTPLPKEDADELSKKCQKYVDELVAANKYKSLISNYLNGYSYYLTPDDEIVKVTVVFSKQFPPVFQKVEGKEKHNILVLNRPEFLLGNPTIM